MIIKGWTIYNVAKDWIHVYEAQMKKSINVVWSVVRM